MRKHTVLAVMAVMAVGASELTAQTRNGAASVTIPEVLVVTAVTPLTIAEGDFNFSTTDTPVATGVVTIDTRANILHAVDVTGSDLTLDGTPLVLQVEGADGTWTAVSATPVKALGNLAMGRRTGLLINFQTEADVAVHGPGEYTGTITYTVLADY